MRIMYIVVFNDSAEKRFIDLCSFVHDDLKVPTNIAP